MAMDLRERLAEPGSVVDLGAGDYEIHGTVRMSGGRTIVGEGATIRHYPTDERWCPAIVLRGDGQKLIGDVRLEGPMPEGSPYNADHEAQHGIELQGATNTVIGRWMVRNVWGDGIYVGMRDGRWSAALTMIRTRFDECGRCGFSLQALRGGTATALNIQRCNMAVLDIEPPGHGWGCKHFTWTDSLIRDHGGGFLIANLGVGKTDTVSDIIIDGIVCPNRAFTMNVRPPEGSRRRNFVVRNCKGGEVATNTPLRFTRVDGVHVSNMAQPCASGVKLVTVNDCTDVEVP